MNEEKDHDLDEPIWGAENMAPVIKRSVRQTFYLLSTGKVPAKKVGDRYVSTRRKLLGALLGEVAA